MKYLKDNGFIDKYGGNNYSLKYLVNDSRSKSWGQWFLDIIGFGEGSLGTSKFEGMDIITFKDGTKHCISWNIEDYSNYDFNNPGFEQSRLYRFNFDTENFRIQLLNNNNRSWIFWSKLTPFPKAR